MSSSSQALQEVVEFWDKNPCNLRHSGAPLGTRQYFDEVEAKKYHVEPHILPFADFGAWWERRVLEVGCGIGTAAMGFVRAGAHYTGIDISERAIELAQQRFKVYGVTSSSGSVSRQNMEEWCPAELKGSFDLVYSFGVLHHTPNMGAALQNIYTLLAPGGELRIMLYAKESWKKIMIDSGLDQYEARSGVPIANVYTKDEVSSILREHGFTDISIKQTHIFPYKIEPYKQGLFEEEDYWSAMPDTVRGALDAALGWHLLISAKRR